MQGKADPLLRNREVTRAILTEVPDKNQSQLILDGNIESSTLLGGGRGGRENKRKEHLEQLAELGFHKPTHTQRKLPPSDFERKRF